MSQSPKTLEFLQKLKDSGSWNDEYDYSLVNYIKNHSSVILINKKFGTKHKVLAQSLMSKNINISIKTALNKSKYFIENLKALGKYNESYDYSEINYKSAKEKLIVINKKTATKHLVTTKHLYANGGLFLSNAIDKTAYTIFSCN